MEKLLLSQIKKAVSGRSQHLLICLLDFSLRNKKFLLIDFNPQGDSAKALGYTEPNKMKDTISNIMLEMIVSDECDIENRIIHTDEGFDLIPTNEKLSNIEKTL